MKPWWVEWAGRLEWELQALQDRGISYHDLKKDSDSGTLELSIALPIGNDAYDLRLVFPPTYPFTRVEVFAPELHLRWHQNLYSKNVCLLDRAVDAWTPEQSVAEFLTEQFPKLLSASNAASISEVDKLEVHQAEPASAHVPSLRDSVILLDADWDLNRATEYGSLRLLLREGEKTCRGVIYEMSLGKQQPVLDCFLSREEWERRGFKQDMRVRWYRLNEPLNGMTADQCAQKIHNLYGASLAIVPGEPQILGLIFPEEIDWRSSNSSLLFLLRTETPIRGSRNPRLESLFIRTARISKRELLLRAPELSEAATKTIAQIGLGCVGAPAALEFARMGISELRLLDDDVVEPGNAARWPLGLSAVGLNKADAIARFILENFPYTKTVTKRVRVGAVPELGGGTSQDYEEFLNGADLLFDATAELGISYVVSEWARRMKVPFIAASSTHGAWGGRILRIDPVRTEGCWNCFRMWASESAFSTPVDNGEDSTNIPGCADRSFTGASFDVRQVSLLATRTAISIISSGHDGAYPKTAWDVAILSMRDEHGNLAVPIWKTYDLVRHPKCRNH